MSGERGLGLLVFLAGGIDKDDPAVKAILSDEKGEGAVSNEAEELARFIDYYTRTDDVRNHRGGVLDMIVRLFSRQRRRHLEGDGVLLRRFLALTERGGDALWGNVLNLKRVFEMYFRDVKCFIAENTGETSILANGDFESDDAWVLAHGAVYSTSARFSGRRGVFFKGAGGESCSQPLARLVPAGNYTFHFFLRGRCGVVIEDDGGSFWNANDQRFSGGTVLEWVGDEVVNVFESPAGWGSAHCFVVLPEQSRSLVIRFVGIVGEEAYIDYARLFSKPLNSSYTIVFQYEGYAATEKSLHLAKDGEDPIEGVDYGREGYFDRAFIVGPQGVSGSPAFRDVLDIVRPLGIQAFSEFVYRETVEDSVEELPALTGTVAITGGAVVGETLTADTSKLGGSGEVSFRWQRGRSGEWGDIAGAAGSTYEVQPGDVYHYIRVTVAREFFEGEVFSEPVGPIFDSVTCTRFDLGERSGIAVKQDGSLWSWGANGNGRTGLGTTAGDTMIPTRVGTATDWAYVSSGLSHTMAFKADGSLWAWGGDDMGARGLGTIEDTLVPTQVGTATDWAQVVAGSLHTMAIHSDGSLWAWGWEAWGRLGIGTAGWGSILSPVRVGTDTDWAHVSAGHSKTMAIRADGSLWAWGFNGVGDLGDGTTTDRHSPVRIGTDTDWVQVGAGANHSLGIRADGSLWAWGWNSTGQLGDGTTTDRHSPTRVGTDTDWAYVSSGFTHTLAIRRDGTLWAWGSNADGRTGLGTMAGNTLVPTRVGTDNDWVAVSAGDRHTLATRAGGSLWAWGWNLNGRTGLGTAAGNTLVPTRVM